MGYLEDAAAEQSAASTQAQGASNDLDAARANQQAQTNARNDAETRANDAAGDLNQAEADQRQAAEDFRRNPTRANRAKLASANAALAESRKANTQAQLSLANANSRVRDATAAVIEAEHANAAAQRRLIAARNAVTLAEQRKELEQLRARLAEQKANKIAPLGHKAETKFKWDWKVKGHWYQFIVGNWSSEWKGNAYKIVLIHANSVHIGPKLELYAGVGKGQWIAGWEIKLLVGWAKTVVTGYKRDRVFGTKTDILLGAKIEEHIGGKVSIGAAKRTEVMPSLLRKFRDWVVKSQEAKWNNSTYEKTSNKSEIKYDQMEAKLKTATGQFDSIKDTVSEKDLDARIYHASGDSADVSVSRIEWQAGSSVRLATKNGGLLRLNDSVAELKKGGNRVECNGKTTFNGGKIIWKK